MTRREAIALRRKLWRDMSGCTCARVTTVDGKVVVHKANEMCTPNAIRCDGRYARMCDDFKKHGLKLGPLSPGDSGLAEETPA